MVQADIRVSFMAPQPDMRIATLNSHFAATRTLLERTPVAGVAAA
jgi:hypothetical protein